MGISKKVVLYFPKTLVDQPIIYNLVKDYNLMFNILRASINPKEEGVLALELSGKKEDYENGVNYLATVGVDVQPLSRDVYREEDRCTHCGACVTVCPTSAFEVEPSSRKVKFLHKKCIACGLCLKACPSRAMEIRL